ncbi:hypothetical protein BLA60_23280 [Actinophytocola xinjiangensis]|uniref:Uncharacterized protein n=1 Tax=Actinophytocola xinjiangensis TaxID=485602 RepID=A0A7Z0WIV4_9PSEU|nr:hypothetical protein [Actinophytocola xinjiangensis]OLF08354.1 hypothetical protein BLA60_23280 [Actinophytocola xinjiangensis]
MPDAVRRPYLVIVAAVGSLLLLALNTSAGGLSTLVSSVEFGGLPAWPPVVAAVLALLVWRLAPARGWPVLLLAGAACAVPANLREAGVTPDLVSNDLTFRLVLAVSACWPPLTVVGALGAAMVVWQAGRHAVGVALAGAAVASQLVGTLTFVHLDQTDPLREFRPTLVLVLVGVAAVTALAGFAAGSGRIERPPVRVTVAGAVASLAPLALLLLWPSPRAAFNLGDPDQALLLLGIGMLAGGLVVGAVAGWRALLGGLVAGALLGVFGAIVMPVPLAQVQAPTLALTVAVAAVPLGFLAALSRWRLRLGVGGLLVVIAGLVAAYLVSGMDSPNETVVVALEPVLVLAAGVGTVAGVAAVAERLADQAAAPPVLAGLAAPFTLGVTALMTHLLVQTRPTPGQPQFQLPLLAAVATVCVATIALLAIAGVLRRVSRRDDGVTATTGLDGGGQGTDARE